MKVSGRMWLMIILKVTKYQGFTLSLSLSLSLENTFLEKPQGKGGGRPLINSPLKYTVVRFISKNTL